MSERPFAGRSLPSTAVRVLLVIGLLLLALAGFAGFVQTESGFARVVRPLLASQGVVVDATTGRVSWDGRVVLRDATVRREGELDARIAALDLDVDVASLLPGRRVVIEALTLEDAQLTLLGDGSDDPAATAAPVGEAEVASTTLPVLRPAVEVQGLVVSWRDDPSREVGPVQLSFRCAAAGADRAGAPAPEPALEQDERPTGACPLTAELPFRIDGAPGRVSLDGHATERDGAWQVETGLRAETDGLGRLDVEASGPIDGTTWVLAPSAWQLSSDVIEARGRFSGRLAARGHSELRIGVASARPALDHVPVAVRELVADATTRGELRVDWEEDGGAVAVDLELMPIVPRDGTPHRLRSVGTIDARGGAALTIDGGVLSLEADGRPAGTVSLDGGFGEDGVTWKVEALRLAAWLDELGVAVPEDAEEIALSGEGALRAPTSDAPSGEATLRLDGAPGGPLRLSTRGTAGSAWQGELRIEDDGEGRAEIVVEREEGRALATLRANDWDLTPWRFLWERETPDASDAGSAPPGPRPDAPDAADAAAPTPPPWAVTLALERIRLDGVEIENAAATAERDERGLRVELAPSELLGGRVDGSYERGERAGAPTVAWEASITDLDLAPIVELFGEGDSVIAGRLDLESEGAGEGADPWDVAEGRIAFRIDDGQARGTRLQDQLVAALELVEFDVLEAKRVEADWAIEDGIAVVDDFRVGSDLWHLVVTGELHREGLDLRANPRLGPSLAEEGQNLFTGAILGTVDGVLALPFVATIDGPWDDIHTGVLPAAPATLTSLFDGLTTIAEGAAEATGLMPTDEDAAEATGRMPTNEGAR